MAAKRDISLDVTKAVAMFLVVFLHIWTFSSIRGPYRNPVWLNNFCMLAALPPFFMQSGMFSRRLLDELSVKRLAFRLFAYLWPVVTMLALAGLVLRLAMGGGVLPPEGFVNSLLTVGWFFFCLALCQVQTFAVHFISRGRTGTCAALHGLGYVALWALPYGMFHAVEMLPFFWFGVYVLPRVLQSRRCNAVGLASIAVFVAVCCTAGDGIEAGLSFHATSMPLRTISGRGLLLMLGRIGLGLLGGFGLTVLVRIAVSSFRAMGSLAWIGAQTTGMFFIHIHLLTAYFFWVGWSGGGLAGRLCLTLAFYMISLGLSVLTHRNALAAAVLWNPLEPFLQWKKTT